jgi:hypothetical protein
MAHPQTSPRGFVAKNRIDVGTNTITGNSTGVLFDAGISVSGVTTKFITANSTGIRIGSLYISCNSTGNTTT